MPEAAVRTIEIALNASSDAVLLKAYAESGSDEAFGELVRRHAGFVYASALRQVRDPGTARDIAQAVFIALARKAAELKNETVLSGWLFRAIRYLVMDLARRAARRSARETEIAPMLYEQNREESNGCWEEIAPFLDDALAKLRPADRKAVLLRFFEQKSWAEVGVLLGSNENAARIRVNRALGRLRGFFEKRGIAVNVDRLIEALTGNAHVPSLPPVVSAVRGMPTPRAEGLAGRLLSRTPAGAKTLAATGTLLVLVIGLFVALELGKRPNQLSLQNAGRQLIVEVDRTFTANDPTGFLNTIIFHSAQDERFRPILSEYVAAAAEFRTGMVARFNSQDAWRPTFEPLFSPQLKAVPEKWSADVIVMRAAPPYTFVERRVAGEWKWDFFAVMSVAEHDDWIAGLTKKAERFRALATQARLDLNATEAQLLRAASTDR